MKASFDRKKRHRKVGPALVGAGVSLFVFVLYLRTLAPTVLPYDSPALLDVAMLQMQVCVLGITHPTGYPTYLMLSHLFTYLPLGDCAYRVNLASAAYAALAVLAVYAAGLLLSRRARPRPLPLGPRSCRSDWSSTRGTSSVAFNGVCWWPG